MIAVIHRAVTHAWRGREGARASCAFRSAFAFAFAVATMFEAFAHFFAEVLHAAPHFIHPLACPRKTGMTEWRTIPRPHPAMTHHRMTVRMAFHRHDVLAEPGAHLHIGPFASDADRDFIAFLLRTDECLELLQIHDALIAEQHDHIVLFKSGCFRRAVFQHIGNEETEALRKAGLSGDFRRERTGKQAEISDRLCFRCLWPLAMFVPAVTSSGSLTITLSLVLFARTVVFATMIAIAALVALCVRAAIAIWLPAAIGSRWWGGRIRLRGLDGFWSGGADILCIE